MSTGSEHMLGFWWACLVRANPSVLAWHRASSSAPAHLSNLLSPCQPRPPSIPHAPGLGQLLWLGSLPFPLRCHTPTSIYPSKVFSGHAAQLAHPYPHIKIAPDHTMSHLSMHIDVGLIRHCTSALAPCLTQETCSVDVCGINESIKRSSLAIRLRWLSENPFISTLRAELFLVPKRACDQQFLRKQSIYHCCLNKHVPNGAHFYHSDTPAPLLSPETREEQDRH